MRRIYPVVAVVLAAAIIGASSGAAVAEQAPIPVMPAKDQAAYIAKAVAFGIPKELAEQALYDQRLYEGLPVEVVEESGPIAVTSPTGSPKADAQLAAAAATCGPVSRSWSWRSWYRNGLGQNLLFAGIRAIEWRYDGKYVTCPTAVSWADQTSLGALTGWQNPVLTLDTGLYYSYAGRANAAYRKIVENKFQFKGAPCYCYTTLTYHARSNMWLHPDSSADASTAWNRS
jgi:hypothetical protein